jgi:hypothetical protein
MTLARARVPALLLVALVLDAFTDVGSVLLRWTALGALDTAHPGGPSPWFDRLGLVDAARGVVVGAALAFGLAALATRLTGWRQRAAHLAVLGLGGAVAARAVLLAIQHLVDSSASMFAPHALGGLLWQASALASLVGWIAALAATSRRAAAPVAVAAFAVLAVRASPLHGLLVAALYPHGPDGSLALVVIDIGLGVALDALLLVMVTGVVRAGLARPGDEARADARVGIHQVGSALIARVIIAASTVPSAMIVLGVRSSRLIALVALALPAAAAIASLVLAAGATRASRWSAPGAPRLRFATAGVLVAIGAVSQLLVVALLRAQVRDAAGASSLATIQSMEWILPVVDVTGLLVLASAQAASARIVAGDALARRISAAVIALVACMGASTWVLRATGDVERGTWIILSILAAVATAIATLVLARRTHELSDAVAAAPAPEVPTAVASPRAEQEP